MIFSLVFAKKFALLLRFTTQSPGDIVLICIDMPLLLLLSPPYSQRARFFSSTAHVMSAHTDHIMNPLRVIFAE